MALNFIMAIRCADSLDAQGIVSYLNRVETEFQVKAKTHAGSESGKNDRDTPLHDYIEKPWVRVVPVNEDGKPRWSNDRGYLLPNQYTSIWVKNIANILKSGPDFLYAVPGVETVGWKEPDETTRIMRIEPTYRRNPEVESAYYIPPGFIVANKLWREAGKPTGYYSLCNGYRWISIT